MLRILLEILFSHRYQERPVKQREVQWDLWKLATPLLRILGHFQCLALYLPH